MSKQKNSQEQTSWCPTSDDMQHFENGEPLDADDDGTNIGEASTKMEPRLQLGQCKR